MLRKILEFIFSLLGFKKWDPSKAGGGANPGTLGKYIDYANDFVVPLRGAADDTIMYCFPLKADYQKLQAVCDTRLNFGLEGKPLRYFPLTDHVILVMSNIKKGYTLDPTYPKPGYVDETAAQIFMPIAECSLNHKNEWVAQRIVVGVPYIFVDNPYSKAIGREELGFPKGLARFEFPMNPSEATSFNTEAYGIQKFDKENPQTAGYFPWLKINKMTDEAIAQEKSWGSRNEAWKSVKDTFERIPKKDSFRFGLPFLVHELEDMAGGIIPMIFLKQFRDAENLEAACYQAIVEGNGTLAEFKGGWFMGGEYELNFADFDAFPIKENLGLESTMVVKHPFWIKANLEFAQGKVIWEAGSNRSHNQNSKEEQSDPKFEKVG